MPIRPRRSKRHKLALDVGSYVDLTIGPSGEPTTHHEALFREHARRFDRESWASRYYLDGVDTRGLVSSDPADAVEQDPSTLPPGCQ